MSETPRIVAPADPSGEAVAEIEERVGQVLARYGFTLVSSTLMRNLEKGESTISLKAKTEETA